MLIRCGNREYNIKQDRTIDYETFTRRYHLAGLEDKLAAEQKILEALPDNGRRRQREKIKRIERQIDAVKLKLSR